MPNPPRFAKHPRLVKFSVLLTLGLWAAQGASGQTWTTQVRGGGTKLMAISAYNGRVAYAVGDSGKVFKTLDGGAHWDLTAPTGDKGFLNEVAVMNAHTVYATGTRGTLYKTADGGATWQTQILGGPTVYSLAIGAVDAQTVYACREKGAVFKTVNGGLSWENQSLETTALTCHLSAVDLNTVYAACTDDGTLHKTVNGGKSWIKLSPPMDEGKRVYFNEMDAVDADTIFGVRRLNDGGAQVNVIYRSTDGGQTWTQTYKEYGISWFYSISAVNGKVAFASGFYGAMAKTVDGGVTWIAQNAGTRATLYSISVVDENTAFAIGFDGTIIRYGIAGAGLSPARPAGRFLAGLEGGRLRIVAEGENNILARLLSPDGRIMGMLTAKRSGPGPFLLPLPNRSTGPHWIEIQAGASRLVIPGSY